MKKDLKRVSLIMTDYEEGRLQPTPAGHPQLATPSWPPPAGHPKGELLSTGFLLMLITTLAAREKIYVNLQTSTDLAVLNFQKF
jgi:hypothetical protein